MQTAPISEKTLRAVWLDSRTREIPLATSDGRPIVVLDPGRANDDGGPDFRDARIRIGGTLFCGDVELHCTATSWYEHGHETDSHYNRTILHVVFAGGTDPLPARTRSGRAIPLLILNPPEVPSSGDHLYARLPSILPCTELRAHVPDSVKIDWLERLARQRLELKVRRFEERLKELIEEMKRGIREPRHSYPGNPDEIPVPEEQHTWADFANREVWDQLLYEGLMESLGYSKNRAPFLALAQAVGVSFLRRFEAGDPGAIMALLFGTAGLLPSTRTIANPESRLYLRRLRRRWREIRPSYAGPLLQSGDWLFFRLRPPNFPTARLAAASFLLPAFFFGDAFRVIVTTFKTGRLGDKDTLKLLHGLLNARPDEFWRHHYYFGPATPRPVNGIGLARRNDMITNVLIPIVLLYSRVFHDHALRDRATGFLASVPQLQRNTITAAVQRGLFEGARLRSVLHQQGAIRLFTAYCTRGKCGECEIGKRVGLG